MREEKSERIRENDAIPAFKPSLTRKQKRAIERAALKMSGVKRKYQ